MMFFSGVLSSVSAAYSDVDLPEPVGPVVRTAPCGRWKARREALALEVLHAELVQREAHALLVEDSQHDAFAVDAGDRDDADVHVAALDGQADAPVLRDPPL